MLTPLRPRRRRTVTDSFPTHAPAAARETADLSTIAGRIAGLIDGPVTEAIVVMLTELYGEALSRILRTIAQAPAGDAVLDHLCDDRLVGGLLVVHDLHPHSLQTRIEQALLSVPDAAHAVCERIEDDTVYVRLLDPASAAARSEITHAIAKAAPEISRVCIDHLVADERAIPA